MRFPFLSSPLWLRSSSFMSQVARGSGGILTMRISGTAAVGSAQGGLAGLSAVARRVKVEGVIHHVLSSSRACNGELRIR